MVKPLTEEQPEVCSTRILSPADAIITQTVIPARFRGATGKPTENKRSQCKGETRMPTKLIMKYIMRYTTTDASRWRQMRFPWLWKSFSYFNPKLQTAFLHYMSVLAPIPPANRTSQKLDDNFWPLRMTMPWCPASEGWGSCTDISSAQFND